MSRLKRNANTRADINHLSYITFSLELFVEYALTVFEAHFEKKAHIFLINSMN